MYVYLYIYIYISIYVNIYIYSYMPTQNYTYKHTCKCANIPNIHTHLTYTGCAETQCSHMPTQNYTYTYTCKCANIFNIYTHLTYTGCAETQRSAAMVRVCLLRRQTHQVLPQGSKISCHTYPNLRVRMSCRTSKVELPIL